MRTILFVTIATAAAASAAGCMAEVGAGTHGVTAQQYAGSVSVVFTNATPATMCNLSMTEDGDKAYGDNWLPGKLESGKSIELKVRPGRYKATWNTCSHGDAPYFAGTLFRERAFDVKDATQLFAYIPDGVAPTKRAAVAAYHAMVRFEGQVITTTTGQVAEAPEVVAKPAVVAAVQPKDDGKFDAKDFVDAKAAAKKPKMRPSLVRKHDMANDAQVSYKAR
jgi:hypothetical protein